jgi:hypothetical protein
MAPHRRPDCQIARRTLDLAQSILLARLRLGRPATVMTAHHSLTDVTGKV